MNQAASKAIAAGRGDCASRALALPARESRNRPGFPVRRLDGRARLVACALFALGVVALGHLPALTLALGLAVGVAAAARLDFPPTLRRLVALDGFMIFVLALLPFTVPGDPLFHLAGAAASLQGVNRAIEIVLKSNAVMLMMLALMGTMELSEIGQSLGRLGLPEKFVQLFLFTVRYIDVLGQEYHRLRTAMKARGFRMGCNLHCWRSVGYLFGMLLVRSIERSERILAAMRCRGFQGRFPSLVETTPLGLSDQIFLGLAVSCCTALLVWDRLWL